MVTSWCCFRAISGSKMVDVAAVGSVLIPAGARSKTESGAGAVALLAASAVMAETIPPCINLIILGFVPNLSIGGLFVGRLVAGQPDGVGADRGVNHLRKTCSVGRGDRTANSDVGPLERAIASFGLIFMIFAVSRAACAATEISAFRPWPMPSSSAAWCSVKSAQDRASSFVQAATRSGLVLFIVAARIARFHPHASAGAACGWRRDAFAVGRPRHLAVHALSIAVLIVMGSVLEGAAWHLLSLAAAASVAGQARIDPLHFGVGTCDFDGVGLFAHTARSRALRPPA